MDGACRTHGRYEKGLGLKIILVGKPERMRLL